MRGKSRVMLPRKYWQQAQSKQELKWLIGDYINKLYPGYEVLEVHKYYCICETAR